MTTLFRKALTSLGLVQKASRGTLSSYVLNAPHQYGQPLPGAADAQGLITPERMRELATKVPTVSACVNSIMDFSDGIPLVIRSTDPSEPVNPTRKSRLEDLLKRPNPNDTQLHFFHQLRYDLTTLGFAAIEIERDADGNVANLWPLDAARLKIDYDEHGTLLGWDMLDARGVPIAGPDHVHGWDPKDIIYFRRDPVSHTLYSTSRISQLFTTGVIESLMLEFISLRFTDSNIPVGVYDLGEISDEELQEAVNSWNSQALKQHRILLTGSKGSHWYPFGYHLKDLEAVELLKEVRMKIMGILGVTMNELGEAQDVNKSNGYSLSFTFKKRAIEPVMNEITQTLTRRLVFDELGYDDLEVNYKDIDSRDELLQAEIDKTYIQLGIDTINGVKNRRGTPNENGGERSMVFTGSAYLPIDTLEPFAVAQLQAVQAAVLAQTQAAQGADDGGGAAKGPISPPIIRGPQSPEKFTTPDGSGSSSVKIMYGKNKPDKENMGRARGNKQTLQNAGVRKD
jgi:HK97 family phage portal protein